MKTRREHLTVITPDRPVFDESRHDDGDALAVALARHVADDLRAAIAARGQAKLALSGGSTPLRFLKALSREVLDWSRVIEWPPRIFERPKSSTFQVRGIESVAKRFAGLRSRCTMPATWASARTSQAWRM